MSLWEFVVTPRHLLVLLYYLLVYKLGHQLYKDLMNVNELWNSHEPHEPLSCVYPYSVYKYMLIDPTS